jgi:hypothetical protein
MFKSATSVDFGKIINTFNKSRDAVIEIVEDFALDFGKIGGLSSFIGTLINFVIIVATCPELLLGVQDGTVGLFMEIRLFKGPRIIIGIQM